MNTPSPDRETLLKYLHGKLSDAESDQIAQLVTDDPEVRSRLDEIDASGDTFINLLRQNQEDTPDEGYSEYGDVLDRAKSLFDPKNGERPSTEAHEKAYVGTLGEYELLERIGQGGMGVVFKARHTKLGRTVAVKVISDARAADERAIARFEREIKAIGQLDHPSIVHAHDAREIDDRSVLVMEYVDGLDLGRLIRRHGPISTADACELIRQTAIGLQAAHEHGLVHRDIKPSNLMLDRDGNVKILDLGLAREAVDVEELRREISMSFDLTQTGQAMGTADYMAPEQATQPNTVDIRADIYSAGCTLFKLLTGRAPYHEEMTFDKLSAHAEVPLPLTPDLPDPLRKIMERMTAK
ncbi:MAG: serine/threonine-protein kinase, partial [Planctomycetia bacterium]